MFRVFVSHNSKDRPWVEQIKQELAAVGVEAYLFEHDPRPGHSVVEKVQDAIRASQVVLVLLTANSAPSPYVQQEVGYGLALRKLVVPLVEKRAPMEALAMLQGIEYIRFDFTAPQEGTQALTKHLASLSQKHRDEQLVAMALLVGVLILVALSASRAPA